MELSVTMHGYYQEYIMLILCTCYYFCYKQFCENVSICSYSCIIITVLLLSFVSFGETFLEHLSSNMDRIGLCVLFYLTKILSFLKSLVYEEL